MPTYHEGEKKIHIDSWGSHVDRMIREAQARGDFDNVPGMGQPLRLEDDNPFNPEWSAAFRVAKNAGAAPLWVQLDKEIGADAEALQALLERTAQYLAAAAARLRSRNSAPVAPPTAPPGRRWWSFRSRGVTPIAPATPAAPAASAVLPSAPITDDEWEAEQRRARALYLAKAAELDEKIVAFNSQRPRQLSWLEKPRLLPDLAARRFDERCPAMSRQ